MSLSCETCEKMEVSEGPVVSKKRVNHYRPGIIIPSRTNALLDYCRQRAEEDHVDGRSTWIQRYLLVHLAFCTGLRVSEISDLRVDDLQLTSERPYLMVTHPRRRRNVYLDSRLVEHFEKFLYWKMMRWGQATQNEDYVLQNPKGGKYTDRALEFSFKKAVVEAGLNSKFSIHSARHTYAALLLSITRNLELVMRQLGHSSHRITSVYLGLVPQEEREMSEEILTVPGTWKV